MIGWGSFPNKRIQFDWNELKPNQKETDAREWLTSQRRHQKYSRCSSERNLVTRDNGRPSRRWHQFMVIASRSLLVRFYFFENTLPKEERSLPYIIRYTLKANNLCHARRTGYVNRECWPLLSCLPTSVPHLNA